MQSMTALITGATSGIGKALSLLLASKGHSLLICGRRRERLKALEKQCRKLGSPSVKSLGFDVQDPKACDEYLNPLNLRGIEVLVNNAGLARSIDPLQQGQVQHWEEMINTNIKGLLYVTRKVLPEMMTHGRGHIVNVGSVAGRWVYPGGAVYAATKFAVRALSEGLRMDLLGTGLRVSNIEPGMVETEFSQVRLGDPGAAASVYRGMKPLTAEDIAEVIMWCLERPPHVNIQEVVVYPTDQASVTHVHRSLSTPSPSTP